MISLLRVLSHLVSVSESKVSKKISVLSLKSGKLWVVHLKVGWWVTQIRGGG